MAGTVIALNLVVFDADHAWSILRGRICLDWKFLIRAVKSRKSLCHTHPISLSQKSEFQELSNDDYFSKNNEFATWLKEKKKMFFSDLSSESARELFSVFVKDWNSQKLESRYYEGISSAPRSAHNWAFKRQKRKQHRWFALLCFCLSLYPVLPTPKNT